MRTVLSGVTSQSPTTLSPVKGRDFVQEQLIRKDAPIDVFYENLTVVRRMIPDNGIFNDVIGNSILLNIISITESYVRDIITKVCNICPISRNNSANTQIPLATSLWHREEVVRTIFQHKSFSSKKDIVNFLRTTIQLQFREDESWPLNSILDEYQKLCEIRHSVIHNFGRLAANNGIALEIEKPNRKSEYKIKVELSQVQSAIDVCTNMVIEINQELFYEMCRRWICQWSNKPTWDYRRDKANWKEIWDIFYSKLDESNNRIPNKKSIDEVYYNLRAASNPQ